MAEEWDFWMRKKIQSWVAFHEYWMNGTHEIPIYIIKYEDLVENAAEEMKKLFAFLLNTEPNFLDKTFVQMRIDEKLSPKDKKDLP